MNDLNIESINFEISNPCNENCLRCYRCALNKMPGFLTPGDVGFVVDEIKSFSSENMLVLLTGGEFFLNKQWRDIIKEVVARNLRFSIYTNGTLMTADDADYIASFIGRGLKEVQFSLYGLDPAAHDAVTKWPGTCEKTKNAIMMLKERGVPLFISVCAMQANRNDFLNVLRWCDKKSIPCSPHPMIFGPSDYSDSNENQRLTKEDLEKVFEESMKNNGKLAYIWGKQNPERLESEEFYYRDVREPCIAGDGTIYPAIGFYKKLGNIHTDSIKEIFYNHPLEKEMRSYLMKDMKCFTCDARDYCVHYPVGHINANKGEMGKYDNRICDYEHFKKSLAERRDKISG